MEFTINSQVLAKSLKQTYAKANSTMPILGHVLIRAAGSQITVISNDLCIQYTEYLEANVKAPGEIAARLDQLKSVVEGASTDAKVLLTGSGLQVSVGRRKMTVSVVSAAGFPLEQDLSEDRQKVHLDSLTSAIGHALVSAGDKDVRSFLNTVHYEDGFAVGTDGISISVVNVPYRGKHFNIPNYNCKPVSEIAKKSTDAELVWPPEDSGLKLPSRLVMSGENFQAIVHLFDSHKYPDWRRTLSQTAGEPELLLECNRSALISSINRSTLFTAKNGKDTVLSFRVKNKTFEVVSGHTNKDGSSTGVEEIDADIKARPKRELIFCLAHSILLRALSDIDSEKIFFARHADLLCSVFSEDSLVHYICQSRV